jgi:hypothetical protein
LARSFFLSRHTEEVALGQRGKAVVEMLEYTTAGYKAGQSGMFGKPEYAR